MRALLVSLLLTLFTFTSYAQEWHTPSQITVSSPKKLSNFTRKAMEVTVDITNDSDAQLIGPFRLVVNASSHTIMGLDGEENGKAFKILPFTALAANSTRQVVLKLEHARKRFNFDFSVQSRGTDTSGSVLNLDDNQIALFYKREDGNYSGWGLHLWSGQACGNYAEPTTSSPHFNNWGSPYPADGVDPEYGAFFILTVEPGAQCYNFIVHKGDERGVGSGDQQFDPTQGQEAFTFHGNGNIWYFPVATPPVFASGASAHWLTPDTLVWGNVVDAAEYRLYHAEDADMAVVFGLLANKGESVNLVSSEWDTSLKQQFPHLSDFSGFSVSVSPEQAKAMAKGQLIAVALDNNENVLAATHVQRAALLDSLYTSAPNDADEAQLGVQYEGNKVSVSLWAPTAKKVSLYLYNRNQKWLGWWFGKKAMQYDPDTGIWRFEANKNLLNRKYYRFEVTAYHPLTDNIETMMTSDPYSLALSENGVHSQFINLNDADLQPAGWRNHTVPTVHNPEDAVIYETHIRDFSNLDPTVPTAYQGKYLAFTQTDSQPVQHLQQLADAGLTHIHFLPANDIASIEENPAERVEITDTVAKLCQRNPSASVCGVESASSRLIDVLESYDPDSTDAQALVDEFRGMDGFNWGYDPHHFAAPEGSYATEASGESRVREMRAMNLALHNMGLRTILDVVYNHTASSGLYDKSVLDKAVPGYYHRLNEFTGAIERSTCCENTATEHRMMEKLMIDSLVIFARDYGFDGFRFDLMGHIPKSSVERAREAVQAVDPDTYFYGEGWNFGEVVNDRRFEQASQLNMAGTEIGTFSDRQREAVRGATLFASDGNVNEQDVIRIGMAGNMANVQFVAANGNYVKMYDYQWNGQPAGYSSDPADTVNYISKHDNETLWDQLQLTLPASLSLAQRARIQAVALSIPMLSQGIPFLHMGSELLRSKSLDRNSYDAGDWFNKVDFSMDSSNWNIGLPLAQDNAGKWDTMRGIIANPATAPDSYVMNATFERFKEWLSIRQSSVLFRLPTQQDVIDRLAFHNTGVDQQAGLIVMSLDDGIGVDDIDPQHDAILVVVNGSNGSVDVPMSQAEQFELHPVQLGSSDVALSNVIISSGSIAVPPQTTAVLVKPQFGAQGEGVSARPPLGEQVIYLRGDMNSWGTDDPLSYQGNGRYSVTLDLGAGAYQFKLASEGWDLQYGGGFSIPLNETYNVYEYGDNISVTLAEDTTVTFTFNLAAMQSPTLLLSADVDDAPTAPYGDTTVYLRGSMNGWGTDNPFVYQGNNRYTLARALTAGTYNFKLASQDWSTVNIGASTSGQEILLNTPWNMVNGGSQDVTLNIVADGQYLFDIDASDATNPVVTVSEDIAPLAAIPHIRGSLNNWGTTDPMMYVGNGSYQVNIDVLTGQYQFKVASSDWSAIDLGSFEQATVGKTIKLEGGNNINLEVNEDGIRRFSMNVFTTPFTLNIE
ncbi:pullulanase-type alpha-1,6-glucosidase [Alteromonas ponticola]|uniref:Pullulanase-type alpha-1,6-glucosidase n=1 Tax=Alteromonas ponticola TaxID=2720613 RepID=A0ABX1R2C0_9ALTE|nr:pullulanase-type alpha-1,6-glucosidase [Alteromonas ponticola]NMH60618.1 pullulanase-type alpha-1,6-glucosidase [Alteromonas ponticola]